MSRSFGEIIRRRRSALGMTQARLAQLVGRSSSTVRAWERDRAHPSDEETLGAVVAVLGITPAELIEADLTFPGGARVSHPPVSKDWPDEPQARVIAMGTSVRPEEAAGGRMEEASEPEPAEHAIQEELLGESEPAIQEELLGEARSAEPVIEEEPFDEPEPVVDEGLPGGVPEVSDDATPEGDRDLSEPRAGEAASEQQETDTTSSSTDGGEHAASDVGFRDSLPPGDLNLTGRSAAPAGDASAFGDGSAFGDERTSILPDGGARVIGIGTSTDALRPEPAEPIVEEPPAAQFPDGQFPEGESPEGQSPEGQSPEGESPEDDVDPFEVTQVAPRPAPRPTLLRERATRIGDPAGSTMAFERRPPAPAFDNYLDDQEEERRYRTRAILTAVAVIVLLILLRWALSGMGEAIGQLWSNFRANLKL